MLGLIGVVAHDGRSVVPEEELKALVRCYAVLRGASPVRHVAAGGWARFAQFGVAADRSPNGSGDWAIHAGALHTLGSLLEANLDELDGQFAAVRFRAEEGVLEAFSDPFGMQQFYCAEHADRTYVSTSATALAAHLHAPVNDDGVRFYLRTGKQLGTMTLWQGVERLDPATVLTFGPHGRTAGTYWVPAVDHAVRAMSLARTIDHVTEVSLATADRWFRHNQCMWADLTGGYDSRLVNALLARAQIGFRANTAGEEETVDVRIARQVARAGGLQWQLERLPAGWRLERDQLSEAVGWGDGTLDVLLLAEVLWRQRERRRFCSVVVNGGGGEHLGPMPWSQEFNRAGRSRDVNLDNFMRMRMLPRASAGALRSELVDELEAFCREYSVDVFSRRAAPYHAELNTSQLDMMYVYRAISHFGAFRSAFDAQVRTELPFYFKDVFVAGFSAHHRWRNCHRLHRGVIERLSPQISAVATERGGPAQLMRLTNAHRFLPYYTRLGRTAVRKIRGRSAPPAPLPASQASAYGSSIHELRDEGVFDPQSMRTGALYDPDALGRMVGHAGTPGFRDWTQLGRIATLELTLRKAESVR